MWWFLLLILVVTIVSLSRAKECYQCGKRNPVVYSKWGARALCDNCWVSNIDSKDS